VFNVSYMIFNNTANATAWIYAELNSGTIDQGYWSATISSSTLANGYYNITINATDFAGNQNLVNISKINVSNSANTAPTIYNVTAPSITPIAGSHFSMMNITFNVTDPDGVADLVDSGARVNVSLAGVIRTNDSGNCQVITSSFNEGLDRTYSCLVAFRFHDNASNLWQVNATINDANGNQASNDSQNNDGITTSNLCKPEQQLNTAKQHN